MEQNKARKGEVRQRGQSLVSYVKRRRIFGVFRDKTQGTVPTVLFVTKLLHPHHQPVSDRFRYFQNLSRNLKISRLINRQGNIQLRNRRGYIVLFIDLRSKTA